MKKFLFCFSFLFLLCGCSQKEQPLFSNQEELKVVIASDLHYYAYELFDQCSWFSQAWLNEDGQMIHYTHSIVENFVSEVIEEAPDLVIISGDLTYNGEKISHTSLANALQQLEDHGIEVAVINGNHDVNNTYAYGYNEEGTYAVETINTDEFKSIYQNFGYNQAYSQDQNSLSYALHLNDTYDLLVIDTCLDEKYRTASAVSEDTMDWIEKELQETNDHQRKAIVVMHHNLDIHCEAIYSGYVLNNAQEMQDLFTQYRVPLVFSGHMHTQHTKKVNDTYEIVSSALSIAPVQYGIMTINDEGFDYATKEVESVEGDEDFFRATSYNKFSSTLSHYFDESTAKAIASYLAEVNLYYFSGNINERLEEFKNDPLRETLSTIEGDLAFYTKYLDVMLSEETSHQELRVNFNH